MARPRVIVVTGGTAGVGRATVRALAQRGDWIGVLARGRDGLDATRREIEALCGRALAIPTDVASAEQVEEAADMVERDLGPIDVWINNAMVSVLAPVREMSADEIDRVTAVTYLGTVHGTKAALDRMWPRDQGTILQVGSALAYRAIPLQSAYCGAKFAVRGFTDSLRSELIHEKSNIKLTVVHLPAVNTPQFSWMRTTLDHHPQPVPPIYQPEVVARVIVWAIDHPRREVNVGWPTVKAIVANKLAPWALDRYLARTGWKSQQTEETVDPARRDNLFAPVPGLHSAHGIFDQDARERSAQAWVTRHRGAIFLSGFVLAALGSYVARRSR